MHANACIRYYQPMSRGASPHAIYWMVYRHSVSSLLHQSSSTTLISKTCCVVYTREICLTFPEKAFCHSDTE